MTTRRNFGLSLLAGSAATALKAQAPADLKIAIGNIAGHAIGRAIISPDFSVEVISYYPFFAGLGLSASQLLASGASERGAFFSLRSARFTVSPIQNGKVFYSRLNPVGAEALISKIYYHPSPNLNFERPETFSDGQSILTLRSRGGSIVLVEDATFHFSSTVDVVETADFSFQGRTLNLRDTGAVAYTVTLTGPAPKLLSFDSLDAPLHVPVAGVFVAAGGRE